MSKLGILVAMAEECRSLTLNKPPKDGLLKLDESVVVCQCGAGPAAAERGAQQLAAAGASALLSWGCAAALAPDLKPGDLILPSQILGADGQTLDTDASWRERLAAALAGQIAVNTGALAESRRIVGKASDKQAIHAATGAVALDMESAAAARVAQSLGLPFLALRSIIDAAEVSIPASIEAAFDVDGRLHVPKMLGRACLSPVDFLAIFRLGQHFAAAMRTLRQVAEIGRKTHFELP